ncbi:MAG: hypothetical protein IKF00_09315 [Solobacterium sp.]|nr:hypothetical protein [Solobacterium sp.]
MKKVIAILSLALLAGCSAEAPAKEPEKTPAASEVPAETAAPETAVPETPAAEASDMVSDLAGTYVETVAGRGTIVLTPVSGDTADVVIDWPNSAAERYHWEMTAVWDNDAGKLVYKDAVLTDQKFDSDGKETDETVYTDGTGSFVIDGTQLTWFDDKNENTEAGVFLRMDAAGMANPWIFTEDLDEAITISGVKFAPPIEQALPEGLNFWHYEAMPGTIGAMYESVNDEMVIRKSTEAEGSELSGDNNEYSKSWTVTLKGVKAECRGDGTLINEAVFSAGDLHYAITYNAGYEGRGMTADQLNSLINGMQ